jgi:hypothetical protein
MPLEILKADCGVHVVPKHRFAGSKVAINNALDSLTQESVAEFCVALCPRPDNLLEVVGQRH